MATKKEVQALQALLEERDKQIAELQSAIEHIKTHVLEEIGEALPSDEARAVFTKFAPRMQTREEMVMLIRAIARIEDE